VGSTKVGMAVLKAGGRVVLRINLDRTNRRSGLIQFRMLVLPRLKSNPAPNSPLTVVGIFAGIGGLERGLAKAGFSTQLMCERDESAQRVLAQHFPNVPIVGDVHELRSIGKIDVLCAGFPCQDLSQAGKTAGIEGEQSGTVQQVFRLLDQSPKPEWILFENVPFMLHLARGEAMTVITRELEKRKYTWAYRVINAQAFGLPQRRKRVVILASIHRDPRAAILQSEGKPVVVGTSAKACGFYWTEGNTGIGWASDALPTLKGGSTIGIPSPPAIWIPGKGVFTPDVRDAERLQGFDPDWTSTASPTGKIGVRWKLVGNSVAVPMAEWIGQQIRAEKEAGKYDASKDEELTDRDLWPKAAWGSRGRRFRSLASEWPLSSPAIGLLNFLQFPLKPLSAAATEGFHKRASASSLRLSKSFLLGVHSHMVRMRAIKDKAALSPK
jgi:DNA (cytosine-5)-methyltransferase 1